MNQQKNMVANSSAFQMMGRKLDFCCHFGSSLALYDFFLPMYNMSLSLIVYMNHMTKLLCVI
jgi:hypothetical protein